MATGGRDDGRGVSGISKNGTVVPNRVFVGGISANTNEDDLRSFFSRFGVVKATKIIFGKDGISKGYGFITYETDEEAQGVINQKECFVLKGNKLNIAKAVKKQPYNRALDSNSGNSAVIWPSQSYSGSSGAYSREQLCYPQTSWPMMWPQQLYFQQQYQYPYNAHGGYSQYVYSITPEYAYPPIGAVAGSDYSETSSADSGERPRPKAPPSPVRECSHAAHVKTSQAPNASRYNSGSLENLPNYVHSSMHTLQHPVFAKTVNGLTVMAYPSSFVMGSPAIVHVKDGSESENVLSELSFVHSPIASSAMTPPPTPISTISYDMNTIESIKQK